MPRLGPKTSLNLADSAAKTISPHNAKPTPPPAAIPFTAEITGLFDCVMAFTKGLNAFSILLKVTSPEERPSELGQPPSTRSAPAQKPLPLPVMTIDLTF